MRIFEKKRNCLFALEKHHPPFLFTAVCKKTLCFLLLARKEQVLFIKKIRAPPFLYRKIQKQSREMYIFHKKPLRTACVYADTIPMAAIIAELAATVNANLFII